MPREGGDAQGGVAHGSTRYMMSLTLSRPIESVKSCGANVKLVPVYPGETHRARGESKIHRVHEKEGSIPKVTSSILINMQLKRPPHEINRALHRRESDDTRIVSTRLTGK